MNAATTMRGSGSCDPAKILPPFVLPVRKEVLRPRKEVLPVGKEVLLVRKEVLPVRKEVLLVGKVVLGLGLGKGDLRAVPWHKTQHSTRGTRGRARLDREEAKLRDFPKL